MSLDVAAMVERVECACGCGWTRAAYDVQGRARRFVTGHHKRASMRIEGVRAGQDSAADELRPVLASPAAVDAACLQDVQGWEAGALVVGGVLSSRDTLGEAPAPAHSSHTRKAAPVSA